MHQFTLQPYKTSKSRYRCPQCRHPANSFVRYINSQTNQYLAAHVGRCGREDKCGYHFKPRDYFRETGLGRGSSFIDHSRKATNNHELLAMNQQAAMNHEPTYIHPEIVNASFSRYRHNNLVQYLINRFGIDIADRLVAHYRVGTCSYWPGSTVFWQLDAEGLVRTGKIMLYNAETGKRVKQPFNHITWAHTLLSQKPGNLNPGDDLTQLKKAAFCFNLRLTYAGFQTRHFALKQCLFGEHLLGRRPTAHVGIVESEKTALIASAHAPETIWLASGSLSNLRPQLCQALQGRTVTLYPDLGAYHKWQPKARQLQTQVPNSVFTVSCLLENKATDAEKLEGYDLADYLA